jgi:nucleoside 2-deoxyribosyltransferase
MQPARLYLAGPDVFLPDAIAIGTAKKAACAALGLVGVYPLDGERPGEAPSTPEAGLEIAAANEAHMLRCDAIIANLSPFRGPSADPGTCFELGFMRALGRPCFAYSNDTRDFVARIEHFIGAPLGRLADGRLVGADGLTAESFDLADNLMLEGAARAYGHAVVRVDEPGLAAMAAFAGALALAATALRRA